MLNGKYILEILTVFTDHVDKKGLYSDTYLYLLHALGVCRHKLLVAYFSNWLHGCMFCIANLSPVTVSKATENHMNL